MLNGVSAGRDFATGTASINASSASFASDNRLSPTKWKQCRTLFGEHRCNLPLGGPVNARVGPARFPAIQVSLRFFQALKALTFERSFLRMTDA